MNYVVVYEVIESGTLGTREVRADSPRAALIAAMRQLRESGRDMRSPLSVSVYDRDDLEGGSK